MGDHAGTDILKYRSRNKDILITLLSIKPNKKALIKEEDHLGIYQLPVGYTWDDGPFYVWPSNVTPQESKTFKVLKK